MSKVLIIDYEKCVGCQTCVEACSAKKAGQVNPLLSRIEVIRLHIGLENIPIACAQCESAPCMAICPVKAISRDELLDRIIVDYDICIGCRMCIAACPFGCMSFDSANKSVFKCDLCDGDPICVRFCQHDALQYAEPSEQGITKQTATAEKLSGVMHKAAAAMAALE
jgi:Fe-S-cluster-containing hydrogenase component 2